MTAKAHVTALIVAAGRGTRAVTVGPSPKQYVDLGGTTALERSVRCFLEHPAIARVLCVIHADDLALYGEATAHLAGPRLLAPAIGGATRQESVRLGLAALTATMAGAHDDGHHDDARYDDRRHDVLIHDAARPFVDKATISRVIAALQDGAEGAVAGLPLADTLKRVDAVDAGDVIQATVARDGLWRAQTPQGFPLAKIASAHDAAWREGRSDFTDDAALLEWQGRPVRMVMGHAANTKLTTAEDIAMARMTQHAGALTADTVLASTLLEPCTGTGFDVHRFTSGDHVWLCGVSIPHTHALEGHSDADVGLHALTDAILGALGDGDIGQHFPPSDPRWKGAASHIFLAHAAQLVRAAGGRIVNVDVTLLCEAPRVGPHRDAMRARIAEILGLPISRVGVKATTTEQLGFTGRREGIAAMAAASLLLPAPAA